MLQASGRAVGLPDGQFGNSEVGHLTLLRLGVLCGSATATRPGTELFKRDDFESLASRLEMTVLDI